MDYETALCWVCEKQTTFDPIEVPRFNGHPVCVRCATRVNELLTETGGRPIPITDTTYADRPWDLDPDAVEKWLEE